MDWKSVAGVLPAGLDLVGKVIGGPIGAVAQTGGTLLARALGVEASPDSVAAAIQADPARAAEVIKAQLEHDAKIADLATQQTIALAQEETKLRGIELADVANARQRDTEIIHQGGHNYRADFMVAAALIAFGYSLYSVFNGSVEEGPNRELLVYLLGCLTSIVLLTYNFEFGASQVDKSGDQRGLIGALKKRAGL